ncbi:aldehyde dehydrogenase family protein [Paenibacillus abyssi]|uniref:Aldehyde dehydrogenase n=1 Tax=Paenibacillus abyssi TaxID=1340531 RepID=A0A917CMP2_9BACL|nr:aldehyde dehydrogenase family protein [Paenibacillus abyssi]GGF90666.1 aldehyde dehydrogenase [Paenibacillus abyssi]
MKTNAMRKWIEVNAGKRYGNFIGGAWRDASNGQYYALYECALPDNKLGEFPDSGKDDTDAAVQAAHEAFKGWSRTSGAARAEMLFRFADLLLENREQLAYTLSAEQGKVLNESLGEVKRAVDEARFAAGEAARMNGETLPSAMPGIRCETRRYPLGVIAAIAPWNFPVVTPVRKIAPALAYGCTVVLKPASATPWSSVRIMELLQQAGVPNGVVNLVIGSGSGVGDPLVANPLISGISFTGSTGLGIRINVAAAARLTRTQLELGGKNAALVLDYADLDSAASQIVSAAFTCTGQRCTAISRVIVLKDQANDLIRLLIEKMRSIRVGPAWEEAAKMGPLINKGQYEIVKSYIEAGVREGAVLALGGERMRAEEPGYYLAPTLFTGVTREMRIAREEIFGPVLTVMEAGSPGEAAELANATEYGLAACIFTDGLRTAGSMTEALDSGMIHVNHGTASQPHLPFGGVKNSGFGPFSIGHSNQEFFTGLKVVYTKSGG